jgi:hypothetical protein
LDQLVDHQSLMRPQHLVAVAAAELKQVVQMIQMQLLMRVAAVAELVDKILDLAEIVQAQEPLMVEAWQM